MKRPERARILIYSHDSYGLGHLRRSLAVAGALAALPDAPSCLIATGSPRAQSFALPPGCDTVKLPAVTKFPDGRYRSRTLGLSIGETVRVRTQVLLAAARAFRPDLVLVDHSPTGLGGELLPLLEDLDRWPARPSVVLGLRDVIDDVERVRVEWQRLGAWPLLDRLYDRVLVYGDPAVTTSAQELGLPARLPGRVAFTGYLGRPDLRARPGGRRPNRPAETTDLPTVLVTAGGGGDGQALLRGYAAFLESLEGPALFRSVIITGPLLSRRRRRELRGRLEGAGQPVEVLEFTDRIERLLTAAAGVVGMAGYNTAVEVLSAGVPALLVPRESPRLEQRIRAERLAAVSGIEACPGDELRPERIDRFIRRILQLRPLRVVPAVRLDGLARAAQEIRSLLPHPIDRSEGSRSRREVARVGSLA